MVKTDYGVYIDGYLKSNWDFVKERLIPRDWDFIFLVDGREGSGKSVIAMQSCRYLDPTFNLDRVVFTGKELIETIKNAEKGQAILFDEAYRSLRSAEHYADINKALIKMIAEIRQKNLILCIVSPTFFDLEKYVAIWRSNCLIHTYLQKGTMYRGRFAFYNHKHKKNLYVLGKKIYSYAQPSPNFIGMFTNAYVVDEEAYRAKKAAHLHKIETPKEEADGHGA